MHTDSSLGHPIGEINFTYAFTDMFDTNNMDRKNTFKDLFNKSGS